MSRYQPVRARVAGAEEPKEVYAGENRLLARDVLQYARECDRQTAKRQNLRAVAHEAGEEATVGADALFQVRDENCARLHKEKANGERCSAALHAA